MSTFDQDIQNKKQYVYFAYPGKKWRSKVDHMSYAQIIAVYYSLKKQEEKKKANNFRQLKSSPQITIFDLMSRR